MRIEVGGFRRRILTAASIAALASTSGAPSGETNPADQIARSLPRAPIAGADESVYVALRERGRLLVDCWIQAKAPAPQNEIARRGLDQCLSALGPASRFDTAEICFTRDYREVPPGQLRDADVGVLGIEITGAEGRSKRYAPSSMIATNLAFRDLLAEQPGAPRTRVFRADQFLAFRDDTGRLHVEPTSRGNQFVPLTSVDRERTTELARGLANWMARNVRPDGRLTYKYWPSRREASSQDNVIRQFLGSLCLQKLAALEETPGGAPAWLSSLGHDFRSLADRNLEHNLARFYVAPSDSSAIGTVRHDGKIKLGGVALAALAVHEAAAGGSRATIPSGTETSLLACTFALWNEDGSFRTFLAPEGRNDCQNFYPGEALYYWAHALTAMPAESPERSRLQSRIAASLGYYRVWHLRHRNPAFVPWHTMACYQLWLQHPDPRLASWIFEMNDWLLGVQQWESAPHADMVGRFYDPARPFGPPHASSTGVYLEGLIDAFALARSLGDTEREVRYGRAIVGGLRSALQLQFSDPIDLFYVQDPEAVQGALRTTVHDNEVRVDNVQHVLMAVLEILSVFEDGDFATSQTLAAAVGR